MKKRKICIVTTSRADYGSMSCIMREIKEDPALELITVVTGSHLLREFGLTYKEIIKDGFKIDRKVDMLLRKDDETSIVKSIGKGCILFSEVLRDLAPDIVVVLGDRFELLSIVSAAVVLKTPVAHLCGGDLTAGAIDEVIRHAVTKLSTYHFAASEPYRKRIIQMGENPSNVFNYGHPGLDNILELNLMTQEQLERSIDFKFGDEKIAIATYHPVTLEARTGRDQINNLLKAIKAFDIKVVFTKSNCDTGGREINGLIKTFCESNDKKYKFTDNLGQLRYLSCLKNFDLVIGNSSSGLSEAPSFGIPVVNIGDRQLGRLRSKNVIDSGYSVDMIKKAIKKGLSSSFRTVAKSAVNPYKKPGVKSAGKKIKEKLKKVSISPVILKKHFFDVEFEY